MLYQIVDMYNFEYLVSNSCFVGYCRQIYLSIINLQNYKEYTINILKEGKKKEKKKRVMERQ